MLTWEEAEAEFRRMKREYEQRTEEIKRLRADGKTLQEIAEIVGITEEQVRYHFTDC